MAEKPDTSARRGPPDPRDAVELRRAGVADAPALAAFAHAAFVDTYAAPPAGRGPDRLVDVLGYADAHFSEAIQGAELADANLVTVLAESDGVVVGYAQLRLTPTAGAPTPPCVTGPAPRELARIYVDRRWHGRGAADALLGAVTAAAQAAPGGVSPLWLAVYQANARAVAFYRARGFAAAGEAEFRMAGQRQRDWIMVR